MARHKRPRRVLGRDSDLWRDYLTRLVVGSLVCSWRGHVHRVKFGGAAYCGRCGTGIRGRLW